MVDSDSTDGTVDFLRAHLRHPNLSFLRHPPGLYDSWNFGISRIRAKYTAIATCGDTLSRAGVASLLATIERLGCEVLISKPMFEDTEGRPLVAPHWPVDEVVGKLKLDAPLVLTRLEALVFMAADLRSAFTGSCASCLFRTETLQRRPFPADVGAAGDGMWALRNALQIVWGVTPELVSTFLKHPVDFGSVERRLQAPLRLRPDLFLAQSVSEGLASGLVSAESLEKFGWSRVERALAEYCVGKAEFDGFRKERWPWFLRPGAWVSRIRRDRAQSELRGLRDGLLRMERSTERGEQ